MSRKPAVRVLAEMAGRPWLIMPDSLRQMVQIARREGSNIEALEARIGRQLDNTRNVTVRDGIATIPVSGPLFRYANLFTRISGATSFEDLATDLTTAVENPQVKAILLEIDSPGGEVDGTLELAKLILEAREKKPITAWIGGMGASAAYWLASAADEIVAGETSIVGSIGAVVALEDWTAADQKAGLKVYEYISKVSPLKHVAPGTAEGDDQFQMIADRLGAVFVRTVAANREVSEETVLTEYGRGGVLVGADAVTAGLVDRIATFEELHAEIRESVAVANAQYHIGSLNAEATAALVQAIQRQPGRIERTGATLHTEADVADKNKDEVETPVAPERLSRAQLEAEYPEEIGAIVTERVSVAVAAERERLLAIDKLASNKPGHADLISRAKADPQQTAATAALAISEAEAATRQDRAAALKGDEAALQAPAPSGSAPAAGSAQEEVQRTLAIHGRVTGKSVPASTH